MTGRTGLLGQDSHKRTDNRDRLVNKGLPVQVSLKVSLDDNTEHKGKVVTQPDDNIYVIIQQMIQPNVLYFFKVELSKLF
jgi:hypothetical protein